MGWVWSTKSANRSQTKTHANNTEIYMYVNKSVFTFSKCTNKITTFLKSQTCHKVVYALFNKMQIPQTNRPDRGIYVWTPLLDV